MNIVDRFVEYAKMDTQSNPKSNTVPSTEKQKNLGNLLVKQLKEMGIENAHIDEMGYVYAHLKSNVGKDLKKVGFIAHMDTATELTGANVNPQFVDYKGGDIKLNDEVTMTVKEFPCLNEVVGERLITTDGNTLLGADDKSGISIIMDAIQKITSNNLPHGDISIGFTPDEEIGTGASHFDVELFGADFAYTLDGSTEGELEYENFNACSASFDIHGVSVHPGSAKDTMVNACLLAMEINNLLPSNEIPRDTEGYEGFYHLIHMSGDCGHATLNYIVRDHDTDNFQRRKDKLADITNELNKKWGENTVELHIKDQYFNMKNIIEEHMHLIDNAKLACERTGLTPIVSPIRGGTDGCQLSFRGLPCPDIGTGGHGYHGPYEHISVQSMDKVVDMMIELVKIYSTFSV